MTQDTYTWFVRPKSERVHQLLASSPDLSYDTDFMQSVLVKRYTRRTNQAPPSDVMIPVHVHLWRCDEFFLISYLLESISELNLRYGTDFEVYVQHGMGKIREAQFLTKKTKKKKEVAHV